MKTRWFIIFFMFISIVFLSVGCATLPSPEKMATAISGYTLPKQSESESALIYVVRPSGLGGLVRFNVFLDDKEDNSEMGYTRQSQYIYFYVNPGKHTLFSKAENWAEVTVDAKANEIIFIKQNVSMGIIMARNSLEQIQDTEGKFHVKNTSIGTILKERK